MGFGSFIELEQCTLHNALAVNLDTPVVKIVHVFQVIATVAYYPKLVFENHKNQFLMVA